MFVILSISNFSYQYGLEIMVINLSFQKGLELCTLSLNSIQFDWLEFGAHSFKSYHRLFPAFSTYVLTF